MAKKYQGRYSKASAPKHFHLRKVLILALAVATLSAVTIGGTLAYIATNSGSAVNTFEMAKVDCEIQENFNGYTKSNVKVANTSEVPVYIRVKLLPYWYDKTENKIVAKDAWTPAVTTNNDWVLAEDGFYYYTKKVAVGGTTANLIDTINMMPDSVSLSRPVLEIIASCIQAEPDGAVEDAWESGVSSVSNGNLTIKTTGG